MLDTIKADIERLIAAYEREKGRNASLSAALEESRREAATCKKKIEELNKEIEKLKLQTVFTGSSADNDAAKKKVDKMIRELDRCIALMEA